MMFYDEREARRREFIRHFIEQEKTTNQRLASQTLTDDSEESKLASARKQVFTMLNEQMPPAFKQLKKEEEQKMIDCYTPSDVQCEQWPSEGSGYRSTATQKPLTIISLGNEHHHPSQAEMNRVGDQLVDMGVQDFLVVPYQVAIHQTYVPMVAEEKKEEAITSPKNDNSPRVCHHGYVDPQALAGNIIKNEHILNHCRDICEQSLDDVRSGMHLYQDRPFIYQLLERCKTNIDAIDAKISAVLGTIEPESNLPPGHFGQMSESPQADKLVKDITSAININSAESESNTPDFILGQFVADSLAAVNKAIKRRDQWRDSERQADIAGALFDFAGYLTTLENPMTVGSSHDSGTILNHLTAWSKERGISLEGANVEKWNNTGGIPEERSPSKTETVSKIIDVARESFGHYMSKPAGIPGIRVKEIEKEAGVKSETITKIKDEVIEVMRESLKNLVGSPTITKTDVDTLHISANVYPSVPLEYIDVKIELEEAVNVF